mmetsp:Transcript_62045/g.116009  ORF Transcript_62045/g.116009 Transcript_62045/m.116009 type:complete len:443 (-) Transcript_62045:77-1405(-)
MVVEVVVCHATQPGELRIQTPPFAKFIHLKSALARYLRCDPHSLHLVRKDPHAYSAFRDDDFVDETRQVAVVGVDFQVKDGDTLHVGADDMVEDSFGRVKPRPGRNVHGYAGNEDDEPPPLVPGSGFGTFGGLGGIRGFSTLGSLGSRGLIAHKAQAATSSDEELEEDPAISYEEVVRLQGELRDRFANPKFQARLKEVERNADGPGELARRRQELMLEVQSIVLPKYGFEGSRAGVYKMMAAMGPYVERPEFTDLAEEINSLLGLRSPPETWRGLSKACARASKEQASNGLDEIQPNGYAANGRDKETYDNVKGISQPGVWPSNKKPPFRLSIAGSWNSFVPDTMEWEDGLFVFPMEVGDDGWDCFQLLENGSWDRVIYPSIEEAGAEDKYTVCGPDDSGDNRSWQIGKNEAEEATPGSHFVVCVSLDDKGKVSRVSWEKL